MRCQHILDDTRFLSFNSLLVHVIVCGAGVHEPLGHRAIGHPNDVICNYFILNCSQTNGAKPIVDGNEHINCFDVIGPLFVDGVG